MKLSSLLDFQQSNMSLHRMHMQWHSYTDLSRIIIEKSWERIEGGWKVKRNIYTYRVMIIMLTLSVIRRD